MPCFKEKTKKNQDNTIDKSLTCVALLDCLTGARFKKKLTTSCEEEELANKSFPRLLRPYRCFHIKDSHGTIAVGCALAVCKGEGCVVPQVFLLIQNAQVITK